MIYRGSVVGGVQYVDYIMQVLNLVGPISEAVDLEYDCHYSVLDMCLPPIV
jgi:hypothetical protein